MSSAAIFLVEWSEVNIEVIKKACTQRRFPLDRHIYIVKLASYFL